MKPAPTPRPKTSEASYDASTLTTKTSMLTSQGSKTSRSSRSNPSSRSHTTRSGSYSQTPSSQGRNTIKPTPSMTKSGQSPSRSSASKTPNKSGNISIKGVNQQKISVTVHEGPSKFHGLKVGKVDPVDYILPNYWKTINQIPERACKPQTVERQAMSSKITWKGDLETFSVFKRIITDYFRQSGAGYIIHPKLLDHYE